MFLTGLWGKVNPISRLQQKRALRGLHNVGELRSILERESSRAERAGQQFSVVVFDAGDVEQNYAQTMRMALTLLRRRRTTDEVGWFEERRLAAVLPNTMAEGAWKFADDIRASISDDKEQAPACTVYTYPSDWFKNAGGGNDRGSGSRTSHQDFGSVVERCTLCGDDLLDMPIASSETQSEAAKQTRPVKGLDSFFHLPLPAWKRCLDVAGAILGIIVLSPLMLAIAIAIKLTSKGPAVFRQKRAGLGGKPFDLYKFRSMVIDAEAQKAKLAHFNMRKGPAFKIENDPRVNRLGNLLRRWSLDELPQLVNVLKGDMSLVGPRPPTLDEVELYELWHGNRLHIKPGITCLWQIWARHENDFNKWVRLDIEYQRRFCLALDLKILLYTFFAVLSRKGAC